MCFGYPGERAFGDWSTQGELTEIEGAMHSWAVVVSRVLERKCHVESQSRLLLEAWIGHLWLSFPEYSKPVQGRYSENFFLSKYIYIYIYMRTLP